jgi:hypothetical protein
VVIGNPFPLKANAGKSFQGSIVLGKGFIITPEQAQALIEKDKRNRDVLFPYLNGDDLNNDPLQRPSRWVINFFDWSEEKASTYPDCFEIVEQLVKPERLLQNDRGGKEQWWRFLRPRKELYETISQLDQVMVIAQVSKTLAFTFIPKNQVISMMCIAFAFDDYLMFGLLQNNIHLCWVQKYASALKSDTRYTPSDVFETFPFPSEISPLEKERITALSKNYHEFRKSVMQTLQTGLTKIYNQFHNKYLCRISEDYQYNDYKEFGKEYGKDSLWLKRHLENNQSITYNGVVKQMEALRSLQTEIDMRIIEAYGWSDIQLKHNFYELENLPEGDRIRFTIHPEARREILKRLLKLNHILHNAELSFDTKSYSKTGKRKKMTNDDISPTLF